MQNLTHLDATGNALACIIAQAIKLAATDPDTIAAMRGLFTATAPLGGELTRRDLARTWHVSTSTIDRFVHEGMPCTGSRRLRRFDLEACSAWRTARSGPARAALDGEVISLARRNGLRVVEEP